jgi:hypothetical protein
MYALYFVRAGFRDGRENPPGKTTVILDYNSGLYVKHVGLAPEFLHRRIHGG